MTASVQVDRGIVMSRAARAAVLRRRGILAAAHIRFVAMRADPALRQAVLEREYAHRSEIYVVLSTLLLGHLALFAERLPDELRLAASGLLVGGYWLWYRARRRAPVRGRRAAWAGWAVACLVGTAGIVVARGTLSGTVTLPAGLYGLGTFGLGCALAADGRRFEGYGAVRWMAAILLVAALLILHQSLFFTLPGRGGG